VRSLLQEPSGSRSRDAANLESACHSLKRVDCLHCRFIEDPVHRTAVQTADFERPLNAFDHLWPIRFIRASTEETLGPNLFAVLEFRFQPHRSDRLFRFRGGHSHCCLHAFVSSAARCCDHYRDEKAECRSIHFIYTCLLRTTQDSWLPFDSYLDLDRAVVRTERPASVRMSTALNRASRNKPALRRALRSNSRPAPFANKDGA
jgi:hypothetical protein